MARLLALNIGYHHQRYGDMQQNEQGQRVLVHGLQNLVSALAEVMGLAEDGGDEARH